MIKVAVIMGGPSAEHDISMLTGSAVLENIDRGKFKTSKIIINKKGHWDFGGQRQLNEEAAALHLKKAGVDVVFIALHGTYGEDGSIQKLFEQNSIPFTGSGSVASALAMDKNKTNKIYKASKMLLPNTKVLEGTNYNVDKLIRELGLPLFIKPVSQGSSVGAHVVKSLEELARAVNDSFKYDNKVMVQQYIKGREFSCGVLELTENKYTALPPTELIPVISEFFDYKAKYKVGGTNEITPPDIDQDKINEIKNLAMKSHQALGCKGYSRTDMILAEKGFYMIETNTLPGLTPTSILPQQARAAGISFSDLIDVIIMRAVSKKV